MKNYVKQTLALLLISLLLLLAMSGCKKDTFTDDPNATLNFSTDTLTFDTVFTTLGSATKALKVYNENKNSVKVSNVQLGGGEQSMFRINVDGVPGPQYGDLEILGEDSAYVFVEVTVDQGMQNLPFVIYDSLFFTTNGNTQKVMLQAWGQDAFFHTPADTQDCNVTWTNQKPHVVLGGYVVRDGCTLNIQQGTKIYMGGAALILVEGNDGMGGGTIHANGTQAEPVHFRHIRLENFYDDLPGQWGGIAILRGPSGGSTGNTFDYTIMENADYGMLLGSVTEQITDVQSFVDNINGSNIPDVELRNCTIKNSLANGINALFSDITAENCLVHNAGDYMVTLTLGGTHEFTHCTFANYGSAALSHQKPVLQLTNGVNVNGQDIVANLNSEFYNTIIYGSIENELEVNEFDGADMNYLLQNCLLRTNEDTVANHPNSYLNPLLNQDPLFTDRSEGDYNLMSGSPCIDAGATGIPVPPLDLAGNTRDSQPDIGCYEFQ